MNFAEKAFWATCQRLVLIQSVLIFSTAVVFFMFYVKSDGFTLAVVYGGVVSICVTVYRAWRLKVATQTADDTGSITTNRINAIELYKGFFIGYLIVIVLLAIGLSALKLEPSAVIIGFVVAQLAHFFVRPPQPGYGR